MSDGADADDEPAVRRWGRSRSPPSSPSPLIQEEFDDDQLPPGVPEGAAVFFFLENGVKVSNKQEAKTHPWDMKIVIKPKPVAAAPLPLSRPLELLDGTLRLKPSAEMRVGAPYGWLITSSPSRLLLCVIPHVQLYKVYSSTKCTALQTRV